MRLRWHHYRAVIVGRESGNRTPLTFVTFRRLQDAMTWCLRMNDRHNSDGTSGLSYYDWERIP